MSRCNTGGFTSRLAHTRSNHAFVTGICSFIPHFVNFDQHDENYVICLHVQANIPATYLSANMEWTEQQDILRELVSPNCKYKLLYVTPEKVARSVMFYLRYGIRNKFLPV